MSNQEHKEMISRIENGLKIAEQKMLTEKARNGENVIISDEHGNITSVPASNFL